MKKPNTIIAASALTLATLALAACGQSGSEISRDTQAFDGIAETATISMIGNEPFWGMEITPAGDGYIARYTAPDNIDGTQFTVSRFAGNNGIGFNGQLNTDADQMQVQIAVTPGDCDDTMSDRAYPYTATVAMGDAVLLGCAYTSDEPFSGEEMP